MIFCRLAGSQNDATDRARLNASIARQLQMKLEFRE
jgi:hypothetical protein